MAATADWVLEQTNTVGVGSILLSGAIETFSSFADGVPAGEVWYSIQDSNGNRETGIGTFDGDATLARTTVQATLIGTVYNDVNPTPIYLSGNSVVSCVFSSSSYKDLLDKIVDASALIEVGADDVSYAPAGDPVTVATNVQSALIAHGVAIDENNTNLNARIDALTIESNTYEIVERFFEYADFDLTPPDTVVTTDAILSTSTNNLDVYVSGVVQRYGTDFDIPSSTTIRIINKTLGDNDYILAKIGVPTTVPDVDAADVSYTPAGTGAIATNVKARLDQLVSVKDFGAVGDGVTDDLSAIQNAVDHVGSRGGGLVYFPNGNYYIENSSISGAGSQGVVVRYSNIVLFFESRSAVIVVNPTGIRRGISITSDPLVSNPPTMLENIAIINGKIDGRNSQSGAATNESGHGLNIRRAKNVLIQSVEVFGARGDQCFVGYGAQDVTFDNCLFDGDRQNSVSGVRQGVAVVSGQRINFCNGTVIRNTTIGLDLEIDDNQLSFGYDLISDITVDPTCEIYEQSSEGIAIVTPLITSGSVKIERFIFMPRRLDANETLIEIDVNTTAGKAEEIIIANVASTGSVTFKGVSLIRANKVKIVNCNFGTCADDVIHISTGSGNINVSNCNGISASGEGLRMQEADFLSRVKVTASGNDFASNGGRGIQIQGAYDVSIEGGFYQGTVAGMTVQGNGTSDTNPHVTMSGGVLTGKGGGVKALALSTNVGAFLATGTIFRVDVGETAAISANSAIGGQPLLVNPLIQVGGVVKLDSREFILDSAVNNIFIADAVQHQNTTAELADIAGFANTVSKSAGKMVFNTTTGKPVFSAGGNANSVWTDATGATVHTPV